MAYARLPSMVWGFVFFFGNFFVFLNRINDHQKSDGQCKLDFSYFVLQFDSLISIKGLMVFLVGAAAV